MTDNDMVRNTTSRAVNQKADVFNVQLGVFDWGMNVKILQIKGLQAHWRNPSMVVCHPG